MGARASKAQTFKLGFRPFSDDRPFLLQNGPLPQFYLLGFNCGLRCAIVLFNGLNGLQSLSPFRHGVACKYHAHPAARDTNLEKESILSVPLGRLPGSNTFLDAAGESVVYWQLNLCTRFLSPTLGLRCAIVLPRLSLHARW